MHAVTTYRAKRSKRIVNKIEVDQRATERKILGITLEDKKHNKWIRQKIKVDDITTRISSIKWQWEGHVASSTITWGQRINKWRPSDEWRSIGRPHQRWGDDIKIIEGINGDRMMRRTYILGEI